MKPSSLRTYLQATDAIREPILITGQPGCGKSDVVGESMTHDCGRDLIISHPVTSDPTDYKGLPFGDHATGTASFLPFGDLRAMIQADKPTVVFFDDMGQAPPLVQASLMQLVLARRIDGHRVSDHVRFIAATNRRQDSAAVSRILEPVKSRFNIVGLEIDLRDWQQWAIGKGLPVEIVAFSQWKPEHIEAFKPSPEMENSPSPRTMAAAARKIGLGLPSDIELEAIAGDIGKGAASELCAFLKVFRHLPNPNACIMSPDTAAVPDELSARFAICGALARLATENNVGSVIKYTARLGEAFSVFTITQAVRMCPAVQQTGAFISWAATHGDLLS